MRHALVVTLIAAALSGCDGYRARSGPPPDLADRHVKPASVKPFALGTADLILLITGGTNGMLEVCNCAGPMPGGLARRSGLVRSYRAAADNVFLLDTGDVFWIESADVRNGYVLQGYGQIGYDAVVLGDQEWAAEGLSRFLARAKLPYLTGNADPTRLPAGVRAAPAITRTIGRTKLAVVSYVSPEAFRFVVGTAAQRLAFQDEAALHQRVGGLKKSGHLVVVVAHAEAEQVDRIAARAGADLVIRGHTTRCGEALRRVGATPVAKVGGHPYVGVVAMKVSDAGGVEKIEYRVEVVTEHWPLDTRLIQTYQAYAHVAMRNALDAARTKGLNYVASGDCGTCHKTQHAAWSAGAHARAYTTLQRVGRTGDPNCVTCHTTGFGSDKGFTTLANTPKLAGVTCQSCHRFDVTADHKSTAFARTRPRVGEDVCTSCHTPVTDPHHRYAKALAAKPFTHR